MIDGILDTSIMIDLLRKNQSAINWAYSVRTLHLAITPIVWMECVEGSQNKIERDRIIRFLNGFTIEHPEPNDNFWAMQQFAHFTLSHRIEWSDILIASVAVRLKVPLFTLNLRHYQLLPSVDEQRPYN